MDREKCLEAAKKQLETNIFYHSLALEACMGGLYDYFLQNNQFQLKADQPLAETDSDPPKEDWLLAGLIHDIDYSGEYKPTHPQKTLEVLAKYNLNINESIHRIIKAHAPELTGYQPKNKAEWSIFCADSLTGLIVAVALILPTKKLADVQLKSVVKRFLKQPKFAAGTRREQVKMCENPNGLNLPLEKFIEICLASMQKIADQIGL